MCHYVLAHVHVWVLTVRPDRECDEYHAGETVEVLVPAEYKVVQAIGTFSCTVVITRPCLAHVWVGCNYITVILRTDTSERWFMRADAGGHCVEIYPAEYV
jgi:hypothetical protein